MGLNGLMKSYVTRYIKSLLWRSALCGADVSARPIKHTAFFAAPHNLVRELARTASGKGLPSSASGEQSHGFAGAVDQKITSG
jgi:hypothetical protein